MGVVYVPYIPEHMNDLGYSLPIPLWLYSLLSWAYRIGCDQDTPEEAMLPDGDEIRDQDATVEEMRQYKSPFTLENVKDPRPGPWHKLFLCYVAVMMFIGSQIPMLLSFGYSFPQASVIFAVTGLVAIAVALSLVC